ncbi:MAG: hypothetical protein J1E80_07190 [Desulfovibrionaceae bacterium]|nr:hypothetical protein [Desulfovibrionaceae bacterium]
MHSFLVRLCAALLCVGLYARPAQAVPDIADFSLGMIRGDILLRATSPCGDKLCGQVGFGGAVWGASFRFRDDALDAISLFGPPRDDYVEAAFAAFADSPYVVYRVIGDNAVFDFPSLAAEGLSPDALDAAFGEFTRTLSGTGGSFASFFYTEPAVYAAMKREAEDAFRASAGEARKKKPDHEAEREKNASPPPGRTPAPPDADAAHTGKEDTEQDAAAQPQAEPEARSDGVVCAMTVAGDGIVILIMSRVDLEAEMEARAARLTPAGGARAGGDPVSVSPGSSG